jgi:hypothetical protein
MHMGVCGSDGSRVRGDCQGTTSIGAGVGLANVCRMDGLWVMVGRLPGMLFCVVCKCDCLIALRVCFVVVLGTAIIGGATSVMHWRVSGLSW